LRLLFRAVEQLLHLLLKLLQLLLQLTVAYCLPRGAGVPFYPREEEQQAHHRRKASGLRGPFLRPRRPAGRKDKLSHRDAHGRREGRRGVGHPAANWQVLVGVGLRHNRGRSRKGSTLRHPVWVPPGRRRGRGNRQRHDRGHGEETSGDGRHANNNVLILLIHTSVCSCIFRFCLLAKSFSSLSLIE
jgi:hypothetical protein